MFGEGISRAGEIIDLGVAHGIIKKSGSWFSYNDSKLAQGRDAAKQVLNDNPELAEELEAKIMVALAEDAANARKKGASKSAAKSTAKTEAEPEAEPEVTDDLEALDFDAELPDDDFTLEEDI